MLFKPVPGPPETLQLYLPIGHGVDLAEDPVQAVVGLHLVGVDFLFGAWLLEDFAVVQFYAVVQGFVVVVHDEDGVVDYFEVENDGVRLLALLHVLVHGFVDLHGARQVSYQHILFYITYTHG
jgi:hypothetical protein